MSNIREVAEKAGVSPSTVSHVINNTRFVSTDVKDRVLVAIQELNFQPNALARSLRRGKSHTLGLILPDSANPFFAEIGRAVEKVAFNLGYSVIFCNTDGIPEKEDFYLDVLAKKRVDGFIVVSGGNLAKRLDQLLDQGIPMVTVDRDFGRASIDTVLTDNLEGGKLATRYLLELGHRRIACVTGPSGMNTSGQRATGYRMALEEAGLPVEEAYVKRGDFRTETGWQLGCELLELPSPPTAIFACNDMMAIGVLRAAAEYGLCIPEDLSLVGYDDIDLASYTHPPLTTIAQDKQKIGENAVQLLVAQIDKKDLPKSRELLHPQLVIRKSCAPRAE